MKVAARITVATAVMVAMASATYAWFDQRARASERAEALENEARTIGSTLRVSLEAQPAAVLEPNGAMVAALARAAGTWRIDLFPRARADDEAPSATMSQKQKERLTTLIDQPELTLSRFEGDRYVYALSIRRMPTPRDEPYVAAMLEISTPADVIALTGEDLRRA
ncbi:MAG: hypothetical protein AB7L28_24015, partial [Kofleriaceae bacterium]